MRKWRPSAHPSPLTAAEPHITAQLALCKPGVAPGGGAGRGTMVPMTREDSSGFQVGSSRAPRKRGTTNSSLKHRYGSSQEHGSESASRVASPLPVPALPAPHRPRALRRRQQLGQAGHPRFPELLLSPEHCQGRRRWAGSPGSVSDEVMLSLWTPSGSSLAFLSHSPFTRRRGKPGVLCASLPVRFCPVRSLPRLLWKP